MEEGEAEKLPEAASTCLSSDHEDSVHKAGQSPAAASSRPRGPLRVPHPGAPRTQAHLERSWDSAVFSRLFVSEGPQHRDGHRGGIPELAVSV
ncbi:hypothetical protein HPG69_006055 [Diceros bicornis minor]|uniref:Uncharacterized protein n=1 Tax=Diceros bicornis minor TaxID=77932 RepID=A0A7J7EUF2_DICBM|nr:hypothetical protein HPG69_006055 [Diceros bicornis minor]